MIILGVLNIFQRPASHQHPQFLFRHILDIKFAIDLAAINHVNAIAQGYDLIQLNRNKQNGSPPILASINVLWTNSMLPTSRPRVG